MGTLEMARVFESPNRESPEKRPKTFADEEIKRVLMSPDRFQVQGARTSDHIRLRCDSGLRLTKVSQLRVHDINWKNGQVTVRSETTKVDTLRSSPLRLPNQNALLCVYPNGYWGCFHEVKPRTDRCLAGDAMNLYLRFRAFPFRQDLAGLQDMAQSGSAQ
jgi:hypothetical protein